MGGMQAYHWAACHPDMVERAAVVCGSARCSPYNHVFLEGVKAALTARSRLFSDGRFVEKPVAGSRAMGRVYAGWAMSHAFYRDEVWREAGFHSLEDYLAAPGTRLLRRDANDLLAQIGIWQRGDISQCAEFGGDLDRALAAIKAQMLLMPGRPIAISTSATTRTNSAGWSTQNRPCCIRSRRCTATAPETPSTIRATRPSSTPRSQRCSASMTVIR